MMAARLSDTWGAADHGGEHGDTRSGPGIDVLIPTCDRPTELAVTLSGLAAQIDVDFDVIVSDQSQEPCDQREGVASMVRVLRAQGRSVSLIRNLPKRGMAHQRHVLLAASGADHVLCLDDDVWLEPGALVRLEAALTTAGCGFVGAAVQGLSYLGDRRPAEWAGFVEWHDEITPEPPGRDRDEERWPLHNAANLSHIAAEFGYTTDDPRLYRVDWVGGCVLFDRAALIAAGGFDFWQRLPVEHVGEDVHCQRRVMERFGGAGIIPSGAVHLESPTTLANREIEVSEHVESASAAGAQIRAHLRPHRIASEADHEHRNRVGPVIRADL